MRVQLSDAPARQEEIATTIARDDARDRRMIIGAEAHDDILDRGHTLALEVAYRPAQNLG